MREEDVKPDLEAALALLKTAFGKKIPAKIDDISQNWAQLKAEPADNEQYRLLLRQAHTLAGTASTYGFNDIGSLAKGAELLLDAMGEDCNHWSQPQIEAFDNHMVQLNDCSLLLLDTPATKPIIFPTIELRPPVEKADHDVFYLVDDDQERLATMIGQIQTYGYAVEGYADFALFEAALAHQEPAMVIINSMFGGHEKYGIEQMARINRQQVSPMKTIFFNGSHDILTRLEAVQAHGIAYFIAPLRIESLVDAMDRFTPDTDSTPYRVVIVDDSRDMSSFAALFLQQAGMETVEVNHPLQLFDTLAASPPDLILMDIYMPECNGLELSRVIRQMDAYHSIPIVYLSSEQDLKKKLGAMSLGGDDFLSKPIEGWHLVSAVASRVKRGRLMRKLMETDGLTGLLNHTNCKKRLEIELSRARREKSPLAFAMLDIDHFKRVNDTYGHPAGDRVLKSLANMFKQRLRKYDTVGRYGGEEFVVILPDTTLAAAKVIMDQLRISFGEIGHHSDSGPFYCHFSCGIACFPDFDHAVLLNEEADKALYRAKTGGRNQVAMASACDDRI